METNPKNEQQTEFLAESSGLASINLDFDVNSISDVNEALDRFAQKVHSEIDHELSILSGCIGNARTFRISFRLPNPQE